ncbi:MAG: 50S ribosomal protein L15 [Deltaproteobacteria bacterium]|jgi:large subunit ribosomal protein L15|nr:50S ribosomal protein L15 [Deltaproteobacteria bacterium]
MELHDLSPKPGSRKARKRVGRGESSGLGKTSGRGHKGQNARSGGGTPPWFEGGQMPLQRRLPKRGFTNVFKKKHAVVNVCSFKDLAPGSVVNAETIKAMNLAKGPALPIRLLAKGEIDKALSFEVDYASKAAVEKVEAAGGKVAIVTRKFRKGPKSKNPLP